MEDFIVFKTVDGRVAIKKDSILSIYEDLDEEGIVRIVTEDDDLETHETFDSIISKL